MLKKIILGKLNISIFIYSFLAFLIAPYKYKLLKIKSYFDFLFKQQRSINLSIDDLDTYEKCSDFLVKTQQIIDEKLDDQLILKITHARQFLGIDETSFRLKRLRLAGLEYDDLIKHLNTSDLLKNFKHEFYSGEGRMSLGLILHSNTSVIYVTKIIKYKDSYLRELNFYNSIRYLGLLSTITPKLILNSEYNGVFLITLEYIKSRTQEETIPYAMIMKTLSIISNITIKDHSQLTQDNHINRPLYFDNIYYFKRIIYKNLISIIELVDLDVKGINHFLSLLKQTKLNKIVWTLNHGDNLSWNYKQSEGKVFVIDWEAYSIDIFGRDFFGYVLLNREKVQLIEDIISFELEKPTHYKFESMFILFIIMFNDIKRYMNKSGTSNEEELRFIIRILEKFDENNWKSIIIN